jgi:nucleoside 2-deoxyribosyltransferase
MKLFISYSSADRSFAERLENRIRALGVDILSDENSLMPSRDLGGALREALEASDGVVLVVPAPGTAKANNAFFEVGAARALGKPVVAVIPSPEPSRRQLPTDMYELAVFDGSRIDSEALAKSIVTALAAT